MEDELWSSIIDSTKTSSTSFMFCRLSPALLRQRTESSTASPNSRSAVSACSAGQCRKVVIQWIDFDLSELLIFNLIHFFNPYHFYSNFKLLFKLLFKFLLKLLFKLLFNCQSLGSPPISHMSRTISNNNHYCEGLALKLWSVVVFNLTDIAQS